MNIVKYLISKSYRTRLNDSYTKELCNKIELEQKQMEKAFGAA
jgi:hypothetical protein